MNPVLQTFGEDVQARHVIAQAIDYADGAREIAHIHHRAQLVYAMSGIVRVLTPHGLWTLTPGRALLIGSKVEHELRMIGGTSMRTLYIDPDSLLDASARCRLIAVGELLRASILGMFDAQLDGRDALLVPLILRLLDDRRDDIVDLGLPLPEDRRVRQVCEALLADPANDDTLERWAERVSMSSRTLARQFRHETGMTFGRWREQLRLAEAITLLSNGRSLALTATQLGYVDTRTFTTMFKRAFGMTPVQFLRNGH
ncbi:MAG: helix-turn-helix transcriptional regulator [Pandoraea sp.]|nr:helix-turn-helix transcriptional regulator [Pandoraea sp.]MDR3397641.1 helix-turn-helix transcriptional regulator [Pandoraea sp.]